MKGKIFLVGFGPGHVEQMTYRAKEAIAASSLVIGYSTYIKLVEDLLEGKEVIKKGMTEELDRCVLAYEKALAGETVALISSGDIGIYGMAGPMYEYLLEQGWKPGQDVEVEVVPGVTALSAASSLVGAPLTHDFCSISLSDLLTPWPVIARRLEAAAGADFVVALYNPKSGRRTGQIVEAQRILLKHRDPNTPVAIVKSAYRKKQQIRLIALKELAEQDIGMLTTVLIGNSSSFVEQGLLVTPRGYANKYLEAGITKSGEESGRSLSQGLEGWGKSLSLEIEAGKRPEQIAHEVGLPLGEVLGHLQGDLVESLALPREILGSQLALAGSLRLFVSQGPCLTLQLDQCNVDLRSESLTLKAPLLDWELPLNLIGQAFGVQLGGKREIYFLDQSGQALFVLQ